MKANNKIYFIVLFFSFFSLIHSLAEYNYDILHLNSEFPKVCPAEDGNILALSTPVGEQKFIQSKLDKEAKPIYDNFTMNYGYTGSAQLLYNEKQENNSYLLFCHNKQDIAGHESKENLITFSDRDEKPRVDERIKRIYPSMSGVALKNGKILIAGINITSSKYAETTAGVEIYDPFSKEYGNGLTFSAHSNYISCYEQSKNNIYCVYVSYEDAFVAQLRIKHIIYNSYGSVDTLSIKADKVIKNFYTEFNYLKAVAFNQTEAVVLFQTGNSESEPELGNSGQDLFYYHLQVDDTDVVKVKRYELLFNKCKYVKDPEDYNADISVLSLKRIYAICQYEDNKFQGFMITPGVKRIQKFSLPYDNSGEIIEVKNPVFAKFNKSLALFYTLKTKNENKKTAYFLLNYPECKDSKQSHLLPIHHQIVITKLPTLYMSNPYPANRQNEEIYLRILDNSGISIFNEKTNEKILNDFDYKDEELGLKVVSESLEENYSLEFSATRNDELDGVIIGRTCKINLYTPKCLSQCYSCTKKGTEEHNYCLGCAEGSYYEEEDETTIDEGFGKPHNCKNCDISCTSCYGKYLFLSSGKPNQTTNCIKCDYKNGYYHYEKDNRTCISKLNQSEWEKVIEHPIYLDKTPSDKPEQWRWRHCHDNCASCSGPGTDEDNQCDSCKENEGLFFYCNQTKGNGIPGSCHNDCLNNGYYLHKDEEDKMNKCCPCLKHCKVCKNETKCEDCFPPFYKTPEWDKCNKTCNSCLAYDDELRECVFCRDRYNHTDKFPRYNYKQKCYAPILEDFHLIDDVCYNITKCDKSCFTCAPENSSLCTQCSPGYYKEDFFGKEQPKTFRCFSKRQCQGVEEYPPEKDHRVGGVPIEENGELVCLNCKLRNNSYRQPEDNFYCGTKIPKTFVDIDEYNKLTKCYTRCKTCDNWGNACFMNCKSCLDSQNYDLILYDIKNNLGNCYRKAHKCGIYPYYHDYDIATVLGYDEDNCGEKCDVCLYNFTCPDSFPYFNFETHECVEFCPLTRVMGNQCSLNNSNALANLLKNPFGLRNPYDFLYSPGVINRLMKTELLQYLSKSYDIDVNVLEKTINNYLESGTIFNLPNSQIIFGNNISITLTSVRIEKEKNISTGDPPSNETIVDLSACEALLKKKYGIPEDEDLLIVKGDTIKKMSESYFGKSVEYQVFSISLQCFLPLNDCAEQDTPVIVTNPFSTQELVTELQNKIGAIVSNGYDPFNSESPFYNDICTPFTNENGNDVLLNERRTDYFNENINICDKDCTFSHYDPKTKMYTCKCKIQILGKESEENGTKSETTYVNKTLPESFYKRQKNSNIEVIKCSSQVFSSSGQKKNFGSYCLITCFAGFLVSVVYYFVKGKESLNLIFYRLSKFSAPASPPKQGQEHEQKQKQEQKQRKKQKQEQEQEQNEEIKQYEGLLSNGNKPKIQKNPENIEKDLVLNDIELNGADYDIARQKDFRTYGQCYWSLLKNKQIFIFTFYTSNDHNLRVVKIALFILFISFYFAFTALFFNDKIMREIYTYKGNTNAAIHVPNIILSTFCCIIMNFIVRFVSLSERDISKITQEKNPEKRKALAEKTRRALKIKLILLFVISGLLIALCWYYVSAFCAVFKNSQGPYFTNLLIAFVVCNIWPCVTSLIPPIFRRKSLNDSDSPCMYRFSQIIAYI